MSSARDLPVRTSAAIAGMLLAGGLFVSSARAEQFIVTDVTYTHAADTTSDSHYRVSPAAGSPTNWKSPVDYTTGSVHVTLEVKTKPGDTPTKFQVCFEATPMYGCASQSDPYTKPGTYEWTTKFADFWYPAANAVDWTKGVNKVALILKDTNNGKPQGNPKYVPTDLRVQVAIVSAGATFAPPAAKPDAGVVGSDAGSARPAPRDAGASDASTGSGETTMLDAGRTSGARKDASTGTVAEPSLDAGRASDDDTEDGKTGGAAKPEDSGCSIAATSTSGALSLGLSLLALALGRRRRARG